MASRFSFQQSTDDIEKIKFVLTVLLGKKERVIDWFGYELPVLGGISPNDLIEKNEAQAIIILRSVIAEMP